MEQGDSVSPTKAPSKSHGPSNTVTSPKAAVYSLNAGHSSFPALNCCHTPHTGRPPRSEQSSVWRALHAILLAATCHPATSHFPHQATYRGQEPHLRLGKCPVPSRASVTKPKKHMNDSVDTLTSCHHEAENRTLPNCRPSTAGKAPAVKTWVSLDRTSNFQRELPGPQETLVSTKGHQHAEEQAGKLNFSRL